MKIEVCTGYSEYTNTRDFTNYTVVDELPKIGEVIDHQFKVTDISEAYLDCEQHSDAVYDYDYYDVDTEEEDGEPWCFHYAVKKEEEFDFDQWTSDTRRKYMAIPEEPSRSRHAQTLTCKSSSYADEYYITDETSGECYLLTWDLDPEEVETIKAELGFFRFPDSNRFPGGLVPSDEKLLEKWRIATESNQIIVEEVIAECSEDPTQTKPAAEIDVP
jgi:hypothetical protein